MEPGWRAQKPTFVLGRLGGAGLPRACVLDCAEYGGEARSKKCQGDRPPPPEHNTRPPCCLRHPCALARCPRTVGGRLHKREAALQEVAALGREIGLRDLARQRARGCSAGRGRGKLFSDGSRFQAASHSQPGMALYAFRSCATGRLVEMPHQCRCRPNTCSLRPRWRRSRCSQSPAQARPGTCSCRCTDG